jgi:hypothetical protein
MRVQTLLVSVGVVVSSALSGGAAGAQVAAPATARHAAAAAPACLRGKVTASTVTLQCDYSGAAQRFRYPAQVSSATFTLYGAQGAYSDKDALGGKTVLTLSEPAGTVLKVIVGGEGTIGGHDGTAGTGGYGGGGGGTSGCGLPGGGGSQGAGGAGGGEDATAGSTGQGGNRAGYGGGGGGGYYGGGGGGSSDTSNGGDTGGGGGGSGYPANDTTGGVRSGNGLVTITYARSPRITVKKTSTIRKSYFGWYRIPVTLSYKCFKGGHVLITRCPKAATVTRQGRDETVTRTVYASGHTKASVTVRLSLDRTPPRLRVSRDSKVTHGPMFGLTCHATDRLSGVQSCHITAKRHGSELNYTATAHDKAGNSTRRTGHFTLA